MSKNKKQTETAKHNSKNILGKVSFVEKTYFHTKKDLPDGCYILQRFNRKKYILVQYDENAKYNLTSDIEDICKAKKSFFPKKIEIDKLKTSKEIADNHLKHRVLSNDLCAIFVIEKGKLKKAVLNLKKFVAKKKFWGIDLENYKDALSTEKRNYDPYGWFTTFTAWPHYLIINFTSDKNFKFFGSNSLNLTMNSYSYCGSGNNFGPKNVKIFHCTAQGKFYKKFEYNFANDDQFKEHGRQIRFSINGDPLQINNFKLGEKHGCQVLLRKNNNINPYKFNYKFSELSKKIRTLLREVIIPGQNESSTRKIYFVEDGRPHEIIDYVGEKKHGFNIWLNDKYDINPDTFIYDPCCKDSKSKISKFQLYQNGKSVDNPFVIASASDAAPDTDFIKEKYNNSQKKKPQNDVDNCQPEFPF